MLAEDSNHDVPSFLMIDVDGERGDGVVPQGDEWGFLLVSFLSSRTGHTYEGPRVASGVRSG